MSNMLLASGDPDDDAQRGDGTERRTRRKVNFFKGLKCRRCIDARSVGSVGCYVAKRLFIHCLEKVRSRFHSGSTL